MAKMKKDWSDFWMMLGLLWLFDFFEDKDSSNHDGWGDL